MATRKKKAQAAKLFASATVENSVQAALFMLAGTPCLEVVNAANKEVRCQLVFMVLGVLGLPRTAMPAFANLANTLGKVGSATEMLKDVYTVDADGTVHGKLGTKYAEPARYGHAIDGKVGTQKYCATHVAQCLQAIALLRSRAGLAESVVAAVNARLVECQALWPDGTYASVEPATVEGLKAHADALVNALND
jgi:hypothetical protein